MKEAIKNAIYVGLVALAIGSNGCSKRFDNPASIARVYNSNGLGVTRVTSILYQGYDQNSDGEIDLITEDIFAQPSGRTFVYLGRKDLTANKSIAFNDAEGILKAKIERDAKRKELAEKIYGEKGFADSDNDKVVSYEEYVKMHLRAGLEYQILGFHQYQQRKTEELRETASKCGDIERMQKIVDAH